MASDLPDASKAVLECWSHRSWSAVIALTRTGSTVRIERLRQHTRGVAHDALAPERSTVSGLMRIRPETVTPWGASSGDTICDEAHRYHRVMRHPDPWVSTVALLADMPVPAGGETSWASARAFLSSARRDDIHIVASVLVVDASGQVLLARHRRYGQWGLVGGHVNAEDASLWAAGARELLEETSLDAEILRAPVDIHVTSYACRTTTAPTPHLDVCFTARARGRAPSFVTGGELSELGWFAPDRLPAPLAPGVAEIIPRAMTALRHDSSE